MQALCWNKPPEMFTMKSKFIEFESKQWREMKENKPTAVAVFLIIHAQRTTSRMFFKEII